MDLPGPRGSREPVLGAARFAALAAARGDRPRASISRVSIRTIWPASSGTSAAWATPRPGKGSAGAPGARPPRRPPQEAETEVTIPFEQAALGGPVPLHVDGKQIDLKVPAGIEDGKKLRLSGQAPGGGDLLLRVRVEPHPYFRRE